MPVSDCLLSSSAAAATSTTTKPLPVHFIKDNKHPNSNNRRDSIAHSQGIGGVAWGSHTIGSWLKDEISNSTSIPISRVAKPSRKPPLTINNTNIIPLLEDAHAAKDPNPILETTTPYCPYLSNFEEQYCKDYSCCGRSLPSLHDLLKHYEDAHIQSNNRPSVAAAASSNKETNNNNIQKINNTSSSSSHPNVIQQDLKTSISYDNPQKTDSNNLVLSSLNNINLVDTVSTNDVFLQPTSPRELEYENIFDKNSYTTHSDNELYQILSNASSVATSPSPSTKDTTHNNQQPFITDPARNLYVTEQETELKPFKCPVINCGKAYKNQNGLKYHKLHGHQNEKLIANDDGTFSILDPHSMEPYPNDHYRNNLDVNKPYRCEVCGKRYKNLNGLKYHKGHSTH